MISKKNYVYRPPLIYVGLFYILLSAWTVVCVVLLGSRAVRTEWSHLGQWLMIAFVLAYTWYFSMGISYRVTVDEDGNMELTSFRRIIKVNAAEIEIVEGPRLVIGFIRFRLEREKAYLFCIVNNEALTKILKTIKAVNPEMKFKSL